MITIYNAEIQTSAIENRLKFLTNQIYKLLPVREQNLNWQRPLERIIEQLNGMAKLFENHMNLLPLISQLKGLQTLTEEEDFENYRGIIFGCLTLMGEVRKDVVKG